MTCLIGAVVTAALAGRRRIGNGGQWLDVQAAALVAIDDAVPTDVTGLVVSKLKGQCAPRGEIDRIVLGSKLGGNCAPEVMKVSSSAMPSSISPCPNSQIGRPS